MYIHFLSEELNNTFRNYIISLDNNEKEYLWNKCKYLNHLAESIES